MADIFISYARGDEAKIEPLAGALEEAGYSVWWDREIVGGAEFAEDIERELNAAKAVIVAWSASGNKSPWVKDEATAAHKQNKMVPVAIDGHEPPMGFRQYQAIDISRWKNDPENFAFANLLHSIEACITGETTHAPLNGGPRRLWSGLFAKPAAIIGIAAVLVIAITTIVFLSRDNALLSERVSAANTNNAEQSIARPVLAKSIAVLPFINRSPDPEDAYFAGGIHDDLLTRLYKIADMHVISRTSVMGYVGTDKKIPEIARELGVVAVLEGGVQRSGDHVRINVQLVDAASDTHLWAETYDRELTAENIFDIQTEIAEAVTGALRIVMSAAETEGLKRLPTNNLAAYEAFMKGRQEKEMRTSASLKAAIEHFRRAIELDPDYALAYANLADSYHLLGIFGAMPRSEAMALAEPLAKKAIELDPLSGEAWTSLGFVRSMRPRPVVRAQASEDYEEAVNAFERAIELSPNYATAYHWYSLSKANQGKYEEALSLIRKAAALDPLSRAINANFADSLSANGRFDEAEAKIQANMEMFSEFAVNYVTMANFQSGVRGRLDEDVRWRKKAIALSPKDVWYRHILVFIYLSLGDLESAKAERDRIGAMAPGSEYFDRANLYISVYEHRYDDAVEALQPLILKLPHYHYRWLGIVLARSGDVEAAKAAFETAFPHWADENVTVSRSDFNNACSYASTLMQTGAEAKARGIARQALEIMSDFKRGQFGYSFQDVLCHTVLGDEDAVLAALRDAVDAGQRFDWWMWLRHPSLNRLRERPEFQAAVATIEADMAEQRASLERDPD